MPRLLCLLSLLLATLPAQAHLLNMTQATGEIGTDGEITLTISVDLLRATGGPESYHALSRSPDPLRDPAFRDLWQQLAGALEVRQDGERVPLETAAVTPPRGLALEDFESPVSWPMTGIVLGGRVDPARPLVVRFRSDFAFEEPISLTLLAPGGERRQSRLLVANQASPPFLPLPDGAAVETERESFDLWHHLGVGILHILPGGLDHLLFLLCMFLLADGWRRLLLCVSLFTLAHTLTLVLASYRLIEVPAGWVEALIAASILWLAASLLVGRRHRANPALIAGFGLLHGMGFASALRSLPLDDHQFLLTLVTFNLGVEIGQVIFLAGLWLCLSWCRGRAWFEGRVSRPLATAVALVSSLWLLQRLASL